jgi:hypothetical protein
MAGEVIIQISPDCQLPVSAARTRLCVIVAPNTETGHARRTSPVIGPVMADLSLTESHLFGECE